MYILPISNDESQSFSFTDQYETTLVLKCPSIDCGFSMTPVMDIYVTGRGSVLGVPLIPYTDVLSEYVNIGCLPLDYGAIIAIPDDSGVVDCDSLSDGNGGLVYLNPAEIIISSFEFIEI